MQASQAGMFVASAGHPGMLLLLPFFLILKGPAGPEETPTPITVQPIFYNTYCKPNGILLARKPPEIPGTPRKPFKKIAGNPARASIFCVAKNMVRYHSL